MRKAAARVQSTEQWHSAVSEFFASHSVFVSQTMHISDSNVMHYIAERVGEALAGPQAIADWEIRGADELAALALEEHNANS